MNRNKVFIGYNKDEKRCLLYKKSDDKYIDLETKEVYKSTDIFEKTLVSYNELIKIKGYSSERRIKRNYKKDLNKTINLEEIFIGSLIQVTKIRDQESFMGLSIAQAFDAEIISSGHLLKRIDNSDIYTNRYIDLLTNEVYNDEFGTKVGNIRVSEKPFRLFPFNKEFKEINKKMTKRKVLEKYHDKYGLNSYK